MDYFVESIPPKYTEPNNTKALDYDGSGNLIYQGEAAAGTPKSYAGWSIKKFVYSGSNLVDIQFAGGTDAADKVWNNRASYTYS